MLAQIRNKELGIVELLSLGWNVFIKNLNAILIIIFLIDLPVEILEAAAITLSNQVIKVTIIFLFFWLRIIPLCLSGMAVIFIAERYIYGEKIRYDKALAKSFSRLNLGLFFLLRSGNIVSFFLLLLIIPGIIYWIKLYFVFHVCILRENASQSALRYSASLVKGRWFRSFFTIVSLIFIIFIPAFVIPIFLLSLLPLSPESPFTNFVYIVVSQMIFMLAFYLFTVVNTVFFLNLDYRK
ncbi:hypothetical protein [Iningainema tapete]|uniref:Glycerophosphoryl diester phosphodiesterase membrane domain-containing protein n=1 Tax=Iningainema tapete BLCC-T55 TaxID=2748662 RepID=A0A8J6XLE1_9CYAN|nr:hypothetical protein [Iningainema tapete]MBD2772582.1 hypothetical protein [Iningainema tapete BLCC-T55]